MKKWLLLSAMLVVSGCKGPSSNVEASNAQASNTKPVELSASAGLVADLPLRKHLQCLPKEAAIVAAHRGTSKKEDLPENARSSLTALINAGFMVAEIDVVGLKDGTHVLFHDGVWEEKTTGRGEVAATNWGDAESFLLKDTDGDFSADRLITFEDALSLAKDRLYLEVDFKSSAKYEVVIDAIRRADMADQVILISYSKGQARKLARLAPEMMLSVGADSIAEITLLENEGVKLKNMAVWMGDGPYEPSFITYLDNANVPVLAWPREGQRQAALSPATIAVTDYALQKEPIEGLTRSGRAAYEACLGR